MWLLNVKTKRLQHFADESRIRLRYAIVSHTWGHGEVTFDEVHTDAAQQKPGFAKIHRACAKAAEDRIEHVWIDTCCIDKRSSAELSEAINSMYRWYRYAKVCYAYLSDVCLSGIPTSQPPDLLLERLDEGQAEVMKHLHGSRWFTRGWTLQELIASEPVEFYDREWQFIGGKPSLVDVLSRITHIDKEILQDRTVVPKVAIAQRMSWAAGRETAREEDQAYSLMGIFDVNMPLLYGEGGEKAFVRLQEKIIRSWTRIDHSILAWSGATGRLLAPSVAAFDRRLANDLTSWSLPQREHFELSNVGLRISAMADVYNCFDPDNPRFHERKYVLLALNTKQSSGAHVGIVLRKRMNVNTIDMRGSWSEADPEAILYEREPGVRSIDPAQLHDFAKVDLHIARHAYYMPTFADRVMLTFAGYHAQIPSEPGVWYEHQLILDLEVARPARSDPTTATIMLRHAPDYAANMYAIRNASSRNLKQAPNASEARLIAKLELHRENNPRRLPHLRLVVSEGKEIRGKFSFFEPDDEHIVPLQYSESPSVTSSYAVQETDFMWHLHIKESPFPFFASDEQENQNVQDEYTSLEDYTLI